MNLERINTETFLPLSQSDAREVVGGMAAECPPELVFTELCGIRSGSELIIAHDYE